MPKELICPAPTQLAWREYEEPPLPPGYVRVTSQFGAAKHGTEMSLYKGYANDRGDFDLRLGAIARDTDAVHYPVSLGNMNVGVVSEVGRSVSNLKIGDRVLGYGGFRPTFSAAANGLWKLPDAVSWQSAVCLDPADYAMCAVRDGHARVGDAAAVFSLGAVGLMVVQILRLAGAHPIIAVDPIAKRRELASEMGATLVLDPLACDAGLEIRLATAKRGADVIIDYSGSRHALQDALRGVAYGGTVVAGTYPAPYPAGLDFGAEAHFNTPQIVFSRACSYPNRDHPRWTEARLFEECLRLFAEGKLSGKKIVWPVIDFEELPKVYPKIANEPAATLKLGVSYA